jgi:hypothetical protein
MSDNPSQQHVFEGSVDRKAERDARAKREADADAARKASDDEADAAQDKQDADKANQLAEATHHGEVNIPSTNPAASNISPSPALPDEEPQPGPGGHTAAEHEAAKLDATHARQDAAAGHETHPDTALPTAEGQAPTGNAAPPPGDAEAAAMAKADEESMRRAEDEKAQRAEAGHTAAENGDVAGVAFAPDIEQAKFELRNLGHDFTISLIDRLFAGVQRLEQKLMGGN